MMSSPNLQIVQVVHSNFAQVPAHNDGVRRKVDLVEDTRMALAARNHNSLASAVAASSVETAQAAADTLGPEAQATELALVQEARPLRRFPSRRLLFLPLIH